jgi:N-formylglutamate amidohydrolase
LSYLGATTLALSKIAVLHIPHSSRQVPTPERDTILLDDAALNNELLRITDTYTDELFPVTPVEAGRTVFPLSRLVCDVERFPLDKGERMVLHHRVNHVNRSAAYAGEWPSTSVDKDPILYLHQEWG